MVIQSRATADFESDDFVNVDVKMNEVDSKLTTEFVNNKKTKIFVIFLMEHS